MKQIDYENKTGCGFVNTFVYWVDRYNVEAENERIFTAEESRGILEWCEEQFGSDCDPFVKPCRWFYNIDPYGKVTVNFTQKNDALKFKLVCWQ